MAHSCPKCGMLCHCGGDIDDCQFEGTTEQMLCTHCKDDCDDEDPLEALKSERDTLRVACNDHQIREVQANSRADYVQKQLDAAKARIATLEEALDAEARISKRLEETLRFYADDSEFPDGGVRARTALNPNHPTP